MSAQCSLDCECYHLWSADCYRSTWSCCAHVHSLHTIQTRGQERGEYSAKKLLEGISSKETSFIYVHTSKVCFFYDVYQCCITSRRLKLTFKHLCTYLSYICIRTYRHTNTRTYVHTYLHAYIHAYIRMYV